jgi:hypothetical protein
LKNYLLLILLLLVHTTTFAGSPNIIAEIRQNYNELKKIQPTLLKKSSIELGYSIEGAEFIYYVNNANKVLIVECEFLGETGKSSHEYYFKNDSLFFLFIKEENYNSPILSLVMSDEELKEMGMEKLDHDKSVFTEDRFYFHDDKLIKWLDNKK